MRNIQTAERATPRPKPSFCRQSQRAPRDDAKRAVSKILQNATEFNDLQRKLVPARARTRTSYRNHPRHSCEGGNPLLATTHVIPAKAGIPFLQPLTSFPRRRESPSCTTHVIPAKAGIPFPRHVLRPGHSGLDASLGIVVPSPSCQQIERNCCGVFSLGRGWASRLPVGDALLSGISHIMAPQHLDNILE